MRVKSLQITGFKSFVDKTLFTFRPGITGIVGPNGCGKSNVVDAIRWAMGEQSPRRLRGKGMEDVIFAGSEVRSPIGMAEVVLTFDNADGLAPPAFAGFSEIQVSRRLYRSGESEYLLNKVSCRLRDILDFFRDTGIGTKGYTIVEQGRIAEIVSAKAEERRALIEEAAGISKYKARRQEAERKLQATEQNMLRVSDIVSEIRRQISSIERQARKAARYKRLRETQRLLELSLASDERHALLEQIEQARRHETELRDGVAGAEAELAEGQATLEQQRVALGEREQALAAGSEALFQLRSEIKELESRIGYEQRERASLAEANVAREHERERLTARLGEARAEADRCRDEVAAVEASLTTAAEALSAAEAEAGTAAEASRALEAERERDHAALVDVLTRIARAEDRSAALADRRAEIDRRLRGADEQLEVQQAEASQFGRDQEQLEQGLHGLLADRDRMMGALRSAIEAHERADQEAREANRRLGEVRERRETKRARLASLRELSEAGEDLAEGTRQLLSEGEAARQRHGLRGLVRDVLEPEPGFEAAVDAVLADRSQAMIVERAEGALGALGELRNRGRGRGLFVVEAVGEGVSPGFVPLGEALLDRVRVRPGFEAAARVLLGGVNLVRDLAEAVERYGGSRLPCSFVTRAGDLLTPEGMISGAGGSGASASSGVGRASEIRALDEEVVRLDESVRSCSAAVSAAEQAQRHASEELENLRNRHHTAALGVANHEKDLERTRERVKAIGEAQEGRAAERSGFLAETEAIAAELARLEQVLSESREERGGRQRALDGLGLRIGSAARELSRLESQATERRVHHSGRAETHDRLGEAMARASTVASETADWIAQREAEIRAAETRREELATSIREAEERLAEQLRREEAARLASEDKRDAYERAADQVRALDEASRRLQAALITRREEVQRAELGLKERGLYLENLETRVRDRWSVDLASWKPPVPASDPEAAGASEGHATGVSASGEGEAGVALPTSSESPNDAQGASNEDEDERDAQREARANAELLSLDQAERKQRLDDLVQKIQAIGEVNLGAIEEHEELRERFRFLSEQKADLEGSISQLRDAISRINRTSRKRFKETFDAVNERFQKNFPRLFRGGRASLGLTESEDVLEAGIEIMAQPPGKRLQSVNLLSGGEKTMTAIALLVSVFQVRPSPFFLLDEVDAALDDANVGRFNEIVVELASDSQFLLITHNKRTIEIADILYGVTMEERGVSKLVAVELN